MRRTIAALLVASLSVLGAGCANDAATSSPTKAGAAANKDTSNKDASSTTTKVEPQSAATAENVVWQKVATASDCMCSDASEFHFWIHRGTSSRVLFYLEGGGACFTEATCGPTNPSYTRNLADEDPDRPAKPTGILDFENKANPFRDDSVVFVPYCTGDLHIGDAVHDYGNGVVIHHNGATNAGTALTAAAAVFPAAEQVVVAGSSAGSAGAPVYGGLAHDVFPKAKITVLADASGAYPGTAAVTTAIGTLWGIENALPRWPETAGEPITSWSLPQTFVQSWKHDPTITMANYNAAYDETQQQFVKLAGFPDRDLLSLIQTNNKEIEDAGVPLHTWIAPGTVHTILLRPELYTSKLDGHSLIGWVTDLLDGKNVPNVQCTECGKPG